MAAKKKTRTTRAKGELPTSLNPERVLEALKGWSITKAQFTRAYDATAKPRGAGLRTPPPKLQNAFKKFQKDGDFDAFARTMDLDAARANAALGRMLRWKSQG